MGKHEAPDVLAKLTKARERYESAVEQVEAVGRERLETVEEALTQLDRLLATYEERATGTGDFGGYIAFREQVEVLVEGLPENVPGGEHFEQIADTVDQRRLSESDFDTIRGHIADIRPMSDRLEEEAEARRAYRKRRREAREHIAAIDDRLEELERLLSLAEVDLDAPVEHIREPIEQYNGGVREAFTDYLEQTPAADVLELFALTDRYPLVPMEAPPDPLTSYLDEVDESLTVPELLEYADYSSSKLGHYVADPEGLRTAVATDRTYLERLTAAPFTIDWPPPEAQVLQWTLRELQAVVGRFAGEDVHRHLREIREQTRDIEHFERLRAVAVARSSLDEQQRERALSGALEEERDELQTLRERLSTELDASPRP